MESQFLCPLCNFQYAEQKTPRILTMCGHTFCETCIETLILPNGQDNFKIICPEDDTASDLTNDSMKQFPVNKALLKIIQSNKSKSSFKDSSFDVSKIVKEDQLQQDEQTKELIIAIKQSQRQEPQNNENNNKQEGQKQIQVQQSSSQDQNMCLLHQKPLQVVCVVDLQKICSKCAIFGEHKGHEFKSVQQIQNQNDQFYQDLLAVYDQKTEIMNRVENKQTRSDILSILSANKQNLTKQIKQRFKKLLDTIKNEQKKALLKLQKIVQKVQKDIDDLYRIQPQTIQKYEEWERNSFEKLQIIQKGTFEEKLQLLLVDQATKQKNIIIQGRKLVQKIKTQEDNIITKAQVFLSNINMKSNDKIFDFTENFVQVYDKPPEPVKIKPQRQKADQKIPNSVSPVQSPSKKHFEEDLLYIDGHTQDAMKEQTVSFSQTIKTVDNIKVEDVKFVPFLQSKAFQQNSHKKSAKKPTVHIAVEDLHKTFNNSQQNVSQLTSRDNSFVSDKVIRPTKKKLKSIKVPEKYEKILQGLFADNTQTLDLTNAELGDNIILQICEFIPGTKIKTVKFIRNKLTDDAIVKMLPYLSGMITLNLSQNLLTERVLDIFIEHREMLPKVKSIILSLNKIIERKHKNKIDELRKLEITVSV